MEVSYEHMILKLWDFLALKIKKPHFCTLNLKQDIILQCLESSSQIKENYFPWCIYLINQTV